MAKISRNYFSIKKYEFLRWLDGKMIPFFLFVLLFVSAFIVLWPRLVVIIPPGFNGVVYRPLSDGVDLNDLMLEGAKLKLPWNTVTQYSIQIQLKELKLKLMTADQLNTNVTVSFQYAVNPYTLPYLHKFVGTNYLEKMIIPQVIQITREKVAKLSSQVAFTGDIGQVANDIAITTDGLLVTQLSPPGLTNVRLIRISSVQLSSVEYPPDVQTAIVNKLVEAENADAYKFKIQAAHSEAERKVIEANGIKGFQDIVNDGMTDRYLKYRGIQATEELAKSANAKTVIFGSGPSGLPLILGNAVENTSASSAAPVVETQKPTAASQTAKPPAPKPGVKD